MAKKITIVTDNNTLRTKYHKLQAGDVVVGRVSCRPTEEYLLFELADRGVKMVPSALSQLICRSKVFQTEVLANWMLPGTRSVHDIHQLQDAMQVMGDYQQGVVTKLDRKNAGLGIHRWRSSEDVFNSASLGVLPFPFVVQPFEPGSRDIRVILLGDYVEAYWRTNDNNFRNNLHFGGVSKVCDLSALQLAMCREIMARAKFPYAHVDLMVREDGQTFLAEINLRGGIRGAQIRPSEYSLRVKEIHRDILAGIEKRA